MDKSFLELIQSQVCFKLSGNGILDLEKKSLIIEENWLLCFRSLKLLARVFLEDDIDPDYRKNIFELVTKGCPFERIEDLFGDLKGAQEEKFVTIQVLRYLIENDLNHRIAFLHSDITGFNNILRTCMIELKMGLHFEQNPFPLNLSFEFDAIGDGLLFLRQEVLKNKGPTHGKPIFQTILVLDVSGSTYNCKEIYADLVSDMVGIVQGPLMIIAFADSAEIIYYDLFSYARKKELLRGLIIKSIHNGAGCNYESVFHLLSCLKNHLPTLEDTFVYFFTDGNSTSGSREYGRFRKQIQETYPRISLNCFMMNTEPRYLDMNSLFSGSWTLSLDVISEQSLKELQEDFKKVYGNYNNGKNSVTQLKLFPEENQEAVLIDYEGPVSQSGMVLSLRQNLVSIELLGELRENFKKKIVAVQYNIDDLTVYQIPRIEKAIPSDKLSKKSICTLLSAKNPTIDELNICNKLFLKICESNPGEGFTANTLRKLQESIGLLEKNLIVFLSQFPKEEALMNGYIAKIFAYPKFRDISVNHLIKYLCS